MTDRVVVFDLDDTLYHEIDFLKSAYAEIALLTHCAEAYPFMIDCYAKGQDVFRKVIDKYHLGKSVDDLLDIYRAHMPHIQLSADTRKTLTMLKEQAILGLITDGRSVTQRNKIKALGLETFIPSRHVIISEEFGYAKPSKEPFQFFSTRFPGCRFTYVGDNFTKDFVAPNYLGWYTICLVDKGYNIHSQGIEVPAEYLPQFKVNNLCEVLQLI